MIFFNRCMVMIFFCLAMGFMSPAYSMMSRALMKSGLKSRDAFKTFKRSFTSKKVTEKRDIVEDGALGCIAGAGVGYALDKTLELVGREPDSKLPLALGVMG